MATAYQSIRVERREGAAWITLAKPPLNVLDIALLKELCGALEEVAADPGVKVVVLAGEGRAFSAGADIKDHLPESYQEMVALFHRATQLLLEMPPPTLVLAQGHVLGGGCELVLACDMAIAAEGARFGQPEIKAGVFPPIAALLLPRVVGRRKALELLLTGDAVDAQEALRLGLVNRVVPADKLEEAGQEIAGKLTALSGAVVRITKRAHYRSLEEEPLATLTALEEIYSRELMATEDAKEGLRAFLEKRTPVWRER